MSSRFQFVATYWKKPNIKFNSLVESLQDQLLNKTKSPNLYNDCMKNVTKHNCTHT